MHAEDIVPKTGISSPNLSPSSIDFKVIVELPTLSSIIRESFFLTTLFATSATVTSTSILPFFIFEESAHSSFKFTGKVHIAFPLWKSTGTSGVENPVPETFTDNLFISTLSKA